MSTQTETTHPQDKSDKEDGFDYWQTYNRMSSTYLATNTKLNAGLKIQSKKLVEQFNSVSLWQTKQYLKKFTTSKFNFNLTKLGV